MTFREAVTLALIVLLLRKGEIVMNGVDKLFTSPASYAVNCLVAMLYLGIAAGVWRILIGKARWS